MIRTSGYYKSFESGEEINKNSEFERQAEGWKFSGWKEITFSGHGAKCIHAGSDAYIWQDEVIEIAPSDILLVGLCIEPISGYGNEIEYRIYPIDKFGQITSTHKTIDIKVESSLNNTYYRLFSVSELFEDYSSMEKLRVIRGITPYLVFLSSDGWSDDDSLYVKSISLRKIKPNELKIFPVRLINVYEISGVNKDTYYGDEYFSGIFKEGDYVLYINKIEDSGSGGLTFSCSIQSYDVTTDKWYDAVVFDDVSVPSGGNVSAKTYTKIATAGLGFKQRVKWSLSGDGTPGEVKFLIGVTYKQ